MTTLRALLTRLHAEEDGMSAGVEALAFGVLVFVVGSIITLNGWAVLDAHFAVNAAAREATRTIVDGGSVDRLSMTGSSDARIQGGAAYDVAVATMSGHGKDPAGLDEPSEFTMTLVDDPWVSDSGPPSRCQRVTVEVRYPVQGIRLPFIGGWQTPITATGQHTEIVDPFRSGLAGRADCA